MTTRVSFLFLARPSRPLRQWVSTALKVWRQRRDLLAMDDTRLRDIGLTREQAEAEAGRPVWDVPSHWLR
jgi:uncharacterized protein YjiS (DUF1127 family)